MTDWRERAVCRQGGGDVWFPEGSQETRSAMAAEARKGCARCPVSDQCFKTAFDNRERGGIWAGVNFGSPHINSPAKRVAAREKFLARIEAAGAA